MATTSFFESFKYGSRLFGFYLAILVVGGGLVGVGGYLAVPEVETWLATGSAETGLIAGGLVLGAVGLAVFVIGQFAILYKLIADGVSRGNADPAVDLAVAPTDEETRDDEPAAEQDTVAPEPEERAVTDEPQPEPALETQTEPEPEPREPAQPPAEASAEQTAQSRTPQPQGEPDTETGREQTAEEIVFGSSDDSTEQSAEPAPEQETSDLEFEEEPESGEHVETAGNSSSDPLVDNFDDE